MVLNPILYAKTAYGGRGCLRRVMNRLDETKSPNDLKKKEAGG